MQNIEEQQSKEKFEIFFTPSSQPHIIASGEAHGGKVDKTIEKTRILFKEFLSKIREDLDSAGIESYEVKVKGKIEVKVVGVGLDFETEVKIMGEKKE